MAGNHVLENVGYSAVGFAIGTLLSRIRRDREDNALFDAMETLRELRSSTSAFESATAELEEVGGNLCSALAAASVGLLVCGGLILAFLFKGEGGDGGRGPHGGDGDNN